MPTEPNATKAGPDDKRAPEEIAEERIAEWRADHALRDEGERKHSLGRFGSLTRMLALEGLRLKEVPRSIRNLDELENLNLGSNVIRELPEWICELGRIKGINLAGNRLRRLPQCFGSLPRLRVLWLQENELEELPESLEGPALTHLLLQGNPGLAIPRSVLDGSPQEILRYYFESRAEGRPLLELKLLLVGRGKAGKTTLVKRLAEEEPDENESETHSIAIRELTLACPRGKGRTRAWDFGGQEILHSTHQFFLTERSLYMLVLEPRTGLAQRDAEYWLKPPAFARRTWLPPSSQLTPARAGWPGSPPRPSPTAASPYRNASAKAAPLRGGAPVRLAPPRRSPAAHRHKAPNCLGHWTA